MKSKIIFIFIILLLTIGYNVSSINMHTSNSGDWPVDLIGISSISISKSQFESWVDAYETCWTDGDHTWCGIPVWRVASMVDDLEPEDYTFNESLANQGYVVKLTSWDGWVTELQIATVAHNSGYLIVNTIDEEELPEFTPRGRPSYPLHLRGDDVFSPNTIGGITKIELVGITDNNPPNIPEIQGQKNGKSGNSYPYYFSTTDPEENNIFYYIDWGDGTNSDWYGPYKSGDEKSLSHNWLSDGTYTIKIKAKDTFDEESDWNTLEVTMPKNKGLYSPLLHWIMQHFVILKSIWK